MALRTNYVDDVLDVARNRERKYNMVTNADGTISLTDVTAYTQEGSVLGASDMNNTNAAVNSNTNDVAVLKNNVNKLNENLSSRNIDFRFAINGEGVYGYLKADDSFSPFKTPLTSWSVNSRYAVNSTTPYHDFNLSSIFDEVVGVSTATGGSDGSAGCYNNGYEIINKTTVRAKWWFYNGGSSANPIHNFTVVGYPKN